MTKEELMRRAIELSADSVRNGGGPFGAVIARNGEIIAEGSNGVTLYNDPCRSLYNPQSVPDIEYL